MGSAPAHFAAVVGMDTYAVNNLFDERFARPRGTSGNTLNFISQYLTERHRTRTLVQVFDDNRITITEHDRLLEKAGTSQDVPDDKRVLIIQASGTNLEQLGPTIVHAAGLEPEQVAPFESLEYRGALPMADTAGYVPPERIGLVIAMARWSAMAIKPPVFLAHAASPTEADAAEALFRAAVPPFIRDYTMCFIVSSPAREAINEVLNLDNEESHRPLNLPRQSAVILAGHEDPDTEGFVILGKTPIPTKGRPDPRRLTRALFEAMKRVPDAALMIPRPPLETSKAAVTQDPALERELDQLRRDLETERGRLSAATDTITALRRELRAAHYSLSAAENTPVEGPESVALPEPQEPEPAAAGACEPDLLGQSPATFADVFALAREHLPLVVLPEKVDAQVDELTGVAKTGVWAARTWAILVTLQAYAQSRADGFGVANVRTYASRLAHPLFPPNQISMGESNAVSTNQRMRTERTFAVPAAVNPNGWQYMEAHVRVDASGKMPAPRLYFYDDTSGATCQIHVGYIGPHLTNVRTN